MSPRRLRRRDDGDVDEGSTVGAGSAFLGRVPRVAPDRCAPPCRALHPWAVAGGPAAGRRGRLVGSTRPGRGPQTRARKRRTSSARGPGACWVARSMRRGPRQPGPHRRSTAPVAATRHPGWARRHAAAGSAVAVARHGRRWADGHDHPSGPGGRSRTPRRSGGCRTADTRAMTGGSGTGGPPWSPPRTATGLPGRSQPGAGRRRRGPSIGPRRSGGCTGRAGGRPGR